MAPHRHWTTVGVYLAIALAILVPLGLYQRQNTNFKRGLNAQTRRNTQEIIDRQVATCKSNNANRITLRTVLEQVAIPPAGRAVDFRKVVGWDLLPPDTQLYVANLLTTIGVGRPNDYLVQVLATYRKANPIQDCVAVERAVTARLSPGG